MGRLSRSRVMYVQLERPLRVGRETPALELNEKGDIPGRVAWCVNLYVSTNLPPATSSRQLGTNPGGADGRRPHTAARLTNDSAQEWLLGPTEDVLTQPKDAYTVKLLESVPQAEVDWLAS
jgi:hypothetical protein